MFFYSLPGKGPALVRNEAERFGKMVVEEVDVGHLRVPRIACRESVILCFFVTHRGGVGACAEPSRAIW